MNIETQDCCDINDIEAMNRTCYCLPLDRKLIDLSISTQTNVPEISGLLETRANLFANTSVFISSENVAAMQRQIDGFENLALLAGYQQETLEGLDDVNNLQQDTRGLFMGYDFHITPDGPRLIEVNTNAGGAFLVSQLKETLQKLLPEAEGKPNEQELFLEMFRSEWIAAGRSKAPNTIAIVDENPTEQYLYPDMLLAKEYFSERGIQTFICDPSELRFENALYFGDKKIDMVYNRLTDFGLNEPTNKVIRDAFVQDAIVLSPAPRHHALYANKNNLTRLDETRLRGFGLSETHIDALSEVPKTLVVTPENADEFWGKRKQYFFKPTSGFGGRATYRGSKVTKRVWGEISKGGYIAQQFIPPTTRALKANDEPKNLKYDLRVYTYAGKTLLMAARIYQGQTTNFRTEGGGFATVFVIESN